MSPVVTNNTRPDTPVQLPLILKDRLVGQILISEGSEQPAPLNQSPIVMISVGDEQSLRCVGGVLLHYYEEQNKRILTASFNPSSTLLYKVDEEAMFRELLRVLGNFAEETDIDTVGGSTNLAIRTNRTGGLFENALDTRIRLLRQSFKFKKPVLFSHGPCYTQEELDIIWQHGDY